LSIHFDLWRIALKEGEAEQDTAGYVGNGRFSDPVEMVILEVVLLKLVYPGDRVSDAAYSLH
jgi:hypothetical protein